MLPQLWLATRRCCPGASQPRIILRWRARSLLRWLISSPPAVTLSYNDFPSRGYRRLTEPTYSAAVSPGDLRSRLRIRTITADETIDSLRATRRINGQAARKSKVKKSPVGGNADAKSDTDVVQSTQYDSVM